jgi:L-rhamnose isomerase/sugar isomerase
MTSAIELQRAYAQALIVDRKSLHESRMGNDVLMAAQTLKRGFTTDVSPILAEARVTKGAAIDPVAAYRKSGYRAKCAQMRPGKQSLGGGIV